MASKNNSKTLKTERTTKEKLYCKLQSKGYVKNACFMPERGTTDAILIARQLQERFLDKNKNIYFVFIDLEKAFSKVSHKVLW